MSASDGIIQVSYEMSGRTVENGPFVYGQVLPNEHYVSWNMGGFIVSGATDKSMNVVSGEMYYLIDYSAVPGSGDAMLICPTGIRRRRRR